MTSNDSNDGAADAPQTRIDEAWLEAGPTPSDEAAARFIDVVIAEPLFCPIWDEGDPEAPAETAADQEEDGESIWPKMVEVDGASTLPLFDSEERLAAFVDEPTSFVALPGLAFFEMMAPQGGQIALNLDVAPSSTLFAAETVAAVAEIAAASGDEEIAFDAGSTLTVSAPQNVGAQTLQTLGARLTAAGELVAEAWLFDLTPVSAEENGDGPAAAAETRHRVLALVGAAETNAELRALGEEAARLAASAEPDAPPLEIAVARPNDQVLTRARAVGVGLLGQEGKQN